MPSFWGWSLAAWVSGLGGFWFLACQRELASTADFGIPPCEPPLKLKRVQSVSEEDGLRVLVNTGAMIFDLAALDRFPFGWKRLSSANDCILSGISILLVPSKSKLL